MTSAPYAGTRDPTRAATDLLEEEGREGEVIATYDAEFRAGFDRKITSWAIDFMTRSRKRASRSTCICPTRRCTSRRSRPRIAGKTKRGNFADLLVQMDAFTGKILDTLDELGLAEDTIVVWASDNGADSTFRCPQDPDPFGGQWAGFSGPWRGGSSPRSKDPTARRASSVAG